MKIKKIQEGGKEILILTNNEGLELTCPFKPAIPVQTQFGQNSLIELPCTNKCALFSLIDNNFQCNAGKNNQNSIIIPEIDTLNKLKITDL
jgi:hypothetical protein